MWFFCWQFLLVCLTLLSMSSSFFLFSRSYAKGSKAASLLLYSIWNEKSLQSAAKKVNELLKMLRWHNSHCCQGSRSKLSTCRRSLACAVGGSEIGLLLLLPWLTHFPFPTATPKTWVNTDTVVWNPGRPVFSVRWSQILRNMICSQRTRKTQSWTGWRRDRTNLW